MRYLFIILVVFLSACAAEQVVQQSGSITDTELLLGNGFKKLSQRNAKNAIVDFDKAIALCQGQYSSDEQKTYASRGMVETIYYMTKAAADKESAIAVGPACSEALFLRGYASLDLGQVELAEEFMQRAIDMAPVNAAYLSEMGHIYHIKREWKNALDVFIKAEEAATSFSPPELKELELSRAKRGVGYSLIELGRIDEAEQKLRECLKINKKDKGALKELEYIEHIRSDMPVSPETLEE